MNAETRKTSYAAEIPVFCALQDSPQRKGLRNDLKLIRMFVKEQLEAKGYTEIDLKTVAHTKGIEIVRASKDGELIRKLLAAGIGNGGLGFMGTAAAAKLSINEGQATSEIRCLLR